MEWESIDIRFFYNDERYRIVVVVVLARPYIIALYNI